MFRKHLALLLVLWARIVVKGNPKILKGSCPTINYQRDFNVADFNGTWYEIGHYNRGFPYSGDCVSYKFNTGLINKFGYDVYIFQKGLIAGILDLHPKVNGKAAFNVALTYPDRVTATTEGYYSFYVMGTDFECVTTVYTCRNIGDSHISSAYILAKDKTGMCYLLRKSAKLAHDLVRQIPDLQSENFDRNEQIIGCSNNI